MKLPAAAEIEWLPTTALAIGSGAGAAAGMGFLPWWTLLFLPFPLLLLPRRKAFIFLAGLILCFLSGWWHSAAERKTASQFPAGAACVSGVLTVTDPRIAGGEDLPMPRGIRGDFMLKGRERAFPVTAYFPAGKLPPAFGRLMVRGIWTPPEVPGFEYDGKKITAALTPLYGRRWILRVKEAELLPGRSGWMTLFLPLREALTKRLTSQISSATVRGMAARFFFGVSDGAPAELKSRFAASGIIHLFAVSGLHVGILATMLLVLFRFLPFSLRYDLTAAWIILYVICTGASVPAVRAGAMIVCWCLLRARLFLSPGWNILMLAWSCLMFFHPGEIGALGTQYSFCITAALILFWERFQHFCDGAVPELSLMPAHAPYTRKIQRRKYRFFRFTGAFCLAPVAFLSGAGITLARQHLFLPGSVIPNLILPFITPLAFAAILFKMIFGAISSRCDLLGAKLVEWSFLLLSRIAETAAAWFPSWDAAEPSTAGVLLFYAALFTLLGAKGFRAAFTGGSIVLALLLFWLAPFAPPHSEVMIFSGMADRPAAVIFRPAYGKRALVLNLPDPETGALAGEELRRRGALQGELFFSQGNAGCSGGVRFFARRAEIGALHLPEGKMTAAFRRNLAEIPAAKRLREPFPDPRRPQMDASGNLLWQPVPSLRLILSDGDRGRRVRMEREAFPDQEITIPWSSPLLLWRQQW